MHKKQFATRINYIYFSFFHSLILLFLIVLPGSDGIVIADKSPVGKILDVVDSTVYVTYVENGTQFKKGDLLHIFPEGGDLPQRSFSREPIGKLTVVSVSKLWLKGKLNAAGEAVQPNCIVSPLPEKLTTDQIIVPSINYHEGQTFTTVTKNRNYYTHTDVPQNQQFEMRTKILSVDENGLALAETLMDVGDLKTPSKWKYYPDGRFDILNEMLAYEFKYMKIADFRNRTLNINDRFEEIKVTNIKSIGKTMMSNSSFTFIGTETIETEKCAVFQYESHNNNSRRTGKTYISLDSGQVLKNEMETIGDSFRTVSVSNTRFDPDN